MRIRLKMILVCRFIKAVPNATYELISLYIQRERMRRMETLKPERSKL